MIISGHSWTIFCKTKLMLLALIIASVLTEKSFALTEQSTGVQTPFEVSVIREDASGFDLNTDGDTADHVLHVTDTQTLTTTNLGLAIAGSVQVWKNLIAFHADEAASGNTDLNDDGDSTDLVLHVFDYSTGTTVNLRMAGSFLANVQITDRLAFGVREGSQRTDLNGDGDITDYVLHIYNSITGEITNTGLACLDYRIAGSEKFIAFQVPESSQRQDLNADGDISDNILHVLNVENGVIQNVQLTAAFRPVITGNHIAFLVAEGLINIDLNTDGDTMDSALHVFDTETGITTSYGTESSTIPPVFQSAIPATTPDNFKVAFIGDQGLGAESVAVLQLIREEGASMVLHQGDFEYTDNPDAWEQQINSILGADFPYFASVGNHDVRAWTGYQQKLIDRLDRIAGTRCTGDLGINSSCTYQGLFFVLSGAGTLGSSHETFIEDELARDDSIWRICSWHKNMTTMQVGRKPDSTGWPVYEICKKAGAMIVTGHEHSYERTKTLISMELQTIDPDWTQPDQIRLAQDASFVVVSGLAGRNIRNQDRCLPADFPYGCKGEWASIYASDQGAQFGALFCTFHVNGQADKAHCYFKDIDGNIPDEFNLTSFMGSPSEPDITVTPASYNFPDVTSGNSETRIFEIRNDGDLNLDVMSITLAGADPGEFSMEAGVDPFMLAPGQAREFNASFHPTSEGTKTATLRIESNDPDESILDVLLTGATPSAHILFEDAVTGGSTRSTRIVTSTNVTAVNGHLYLAAITSKSFRSVTSVSGLGLHWTRINAQCGARNSTGVEVWMAQGAPTGSGPVTATLDGTPSNATIAVTRYSGVDQISPIGNIISGNTNGANGDCTGGSDASAYSFNLTTTASGSMVYSAVAMRHRSHIAGMGYSEQSHFAQGNTGGSIASAAIMDQIVDSPSTVTVDGTFNSTVDYALVGIEILPKRNTIPDILVTPASYDYGVVEVGSSMPFVFSLLNNSCTVLNISEASLAGLNPGDFTIQSGAGAVSLNPGQTQKVVVNFTPTTNQIKNAILRITSNDPDENPFDVVLSGNNADRSPVIVTTSKGPISGNSYAVDVNHSFVYLGVGQQLAIFNVMNPASPLLIGTVGGLGDSVQDIQVIGDLAFVAAGTAGLHIIDVSDPRQPLIISSYATTGFANDIFVLDNHVYLAAGGAGLLIIDVSDLTTPIQVSASETPGWDGGVFVAGGYAYVASGEDGLRVVDISDPSAPVITGTVRTHNDANDLIIEGDLIYVAAGSGGLQIVDIRDPLDPKEMATVDTGYARKVVVKNSYAYVATERDGVLVLDITNPSNPGRVKLYNPHGSANSLDVEGDFIYVADGLGGLLMLNVSSERTNEQCRVFLPALQMNDKL